MGKKFAVILLTHRRKCIFSSKDVANVLQRIAVHNFTVIMHPPFQKCHFAFEVLPLPSLVFILLIHRCHLYWLYIIQNLAGVSDKAVDTSDLLKTLQRLAGEPKKPEPPTAWLFDNEEERANYDRSMVQGLWLWHPSIRMFSVPFWRDRSLVVKHASAGLYPILFTASLFTSMTLKFLSS